MQLTPEASRAGRGLLGWTLQRLAAESGVGFATLSRFENGRALRAATEAKITAAFAAEGIELICTTDRTGAVLIYKRRDHASER